MSKERNELYEFGPFVLNVDERRLARAGGKSNGSLTDKAFQTLCILVRNHGHLITKQELLDQVWPDSFVEENNLDKCIHAIRQALHETPRQKYIETVVKHGYRFVADVRLISANGDNVQSEATDQARKTAAVNASHEAGLSPAAKKRIKTLAMIIGIFVFCASAVGYYMFRTRTSASGAVRSIAVLPIKPINSTTRDELYEIGTADSLINRLSLVKGLVVRPLSSVRKYTDIGQDPLAAGREQKVDYVLDSNYQLADGEFRITSRLINVATGEVEETYKTENDASKIFAVQDAVAAEFGNKLLARLGGKQGSKLAKRGTDNEEAYRLYLQGLNLAEKSLSPESQKAVEYLEQAIRLDPNFARAYLGMADAYLSVARFDPDLRRPLYEKANEAITKALELDPGLPEGRSALIWLKILSWDFLEVEREILQTIELEPNSKRAHAVYGNYLSYFGRFDEAIAEIDKAIELDPNSLALQRDRGRILYHARRYDDAIAQLSRILEVDENFYTARSWLFLTCEIKGDHEQAWKWFIAGQRDERKKLFQGIYETSGWRGVRLKLLDEDIAAGNNHYRTAVRAIMVGDKELAFKYLYSALERRHVQLVEMNEAPAFDSLRDDPRFDEIVRRIGLK